MAERVSELRVWQERLPNPPYSYVPHSATIVSNDGTTMASVGGDLKMDELAAAGEYLAHCATRLPALLAAAEKICCQVNAIPSDVLADHVSHEDYEELDQQIELAKLESLVDDGRKDPAKTPTEIQPSRAILSGRAFTKPDPRGAEYGLFQIMPIGETGITVRHLTEGYEMTFKTVLDFAIWDKSAG